MQGLEKLAFDIYAKNLSIAKKQQLIKELNDNIDMEYQEWCQMMLNFIDGKSKSFKVYYKYLGKQGVLCLDIFNDFYAFYISEGKLGITFWNDMGQSTRDNVELSEVKTWCEKKFSNPKSEEILLAFVKTHPLLRE